MGQFNDTGYGTVRLGATTRKNIRVTRAGDIAEANVQDTGITMAAGLPTDVVAISFVNKQGTQKATCAGAVPIDARVYTAAAGMISATPVPGSFFRGIAQQAGVDGEIIEIMPAVAQAAQA